MIGNVTPKEIVAWRDDADRLAPVLVDVREPWEYEYCRIEGSLHVPLNQLPARIDELPKDRDLVIVCHHGNRSLHAALWLERAGFDRVHNLKGGVEAWAVDIDPTMKRY